MQYTENLGLKKPESTDFYDVNVFNENSDKIDEKVKDIEENTVSLLKGYVVAEKQYTIVYSDTGKYYIGKSGYVPIFVKMYETNAGTIICTHSNIGKDDTGYYVDYSLYNMSGTGVSTEITIEVLYVKDI